MLNPRSVTAGGLLALAMSAGAIQPLAARRLDSEADLAARIAREQNPVKKAKYEIRLGELRLQQAINAYDQGDLVAGPKLLDTYFAPMKDSWKLLKDSGRDATRKPAGFKELDIALREDARQMEDLRHRVPYTDRGPLDRVTREINQTHAEVMAALFPPGPLRH